MTHQASTLINALLLDLKANPDTPPKYAIAAIILATQKAGLCLSDFRELMTVMRAEYGASRYQWERWMHELLREKVPEMGSVKDLTTLD